MLPNNTNDSTYHGERIEDDATTPALQTRRLTTAENNYPAPSTATTLPAPTTNHRNNMIALTLIAVGLLAWLGRIGLDPDTMIGGMILLTIGSCFLFFAFWKRIYGLLIPGCILAGLSIGIPLADPTNGMAVLWGLSAAFFAILGIGRSMFNVRSQWAIFPGVILFGVGMIIAFASLPAIIGAAFVWLPLLLVAAGLYLGWGRRTA